MSEAKPILNWFAGKCEDSPTGYARWQPYERSPGILATAGKRLTYKDLIAQAGE